MDIELIKIDDLKLLDYNPRVQLKPGDAVYERLKQSIENFGYVEPIIFNKRSGNVVGGNQRLQILMDLGKKEVECVIVDLDELEEKSLNIALNKISGEWESEKLERLICELQVKDCDLLLTGFNNAELDEILHSNVILDINEDINYPTETRAITNEGDIWKLGKHYLLCGNSFDKNVVNAFIEKQELDMIFTDPPYDMSFSGGGCFDESMKKIKNRIKDLVNFDPQNISFYKDLNAKTFYIFTSKAGIPKYMDIFKDFNFNILVWCKSNIIPFTNNTFLPDIEYLLYFSRKNKIWNNSLKPTSIYRKFYYTNKLQGKIDGEGDLHPTMKPIDIIIDKIKISSNIGGKVFEPFAGSGTTLIAAELTGRQCLAMEIEPKYCDIIVNRFRKRFPEKEILLNDKKFV